MGENFELFKQYFNEYIQKFGLNNYQIYFSYKPLGNSYARIQVTEMSKIANVSFNSKLTVELKRDLDIKGTAKHEAIHLLIHRLEWIGGCRYPGEEELYEESESLAQRLEKLIE